MQRHTESQALAPRPHLLLELSYNSNVRKLSPRNSEAEHDTDLSAPRLRFFLMRAIAASRRLTMVTALAQAPATLHSSGTTRSIPVTSPISPNTHPESPPELFCFANNTQHPVAPLSKLKGHHRTLLLGLRLCVGSPTCSSSEHPLSRSPLSKARGPSLRDGSAKRQRSALRSRN